VIEELKRQNTLLRELLESQGRWEELPKGGRSLPVEPRTYPPLPKVPPPGHESHMAIYGNITLFRRWCCSCHGFSLVVDSELLCCGEEVEIDAERFYRLSNPQNKRRIPPKHLQKVILAEQGHVCLYCERSFGTSVYRRGRRVKLKLNWDHKVPFSWSQNNGMLNFAAACQLCNRMKGDKVFYTLEATIRFLDQKREEKGIELGG